MPKRVTCRWSVHRAISFHLKKGFYVFSNFLKWKICSLFNQENTTDFTHILKKTHSFESSSDGVWGWEHSQMETILFVKEFSFEMEARHLSLGCHGNQREAANSNNGIKMCLKSGQDGGSLGPLFPLPLEQKAALCFPSWLLLSS